MTKINSEETAPEATDLLARSDFAVPILGVHVLAFAALWPGFFSWTNLLVFLIGVFVFGQGINLGYHRLLAHRSLQVPRWLEYFYVLLAMCCLEETPGKWVATHRKHHTHSDHEGDPHSTGHGFFWAHMGWLLFRRNGEEGLVADQRRAFDIMKDPWYSRLEKYWWAPPAFFGAQVAVYFAVGWLVAVLQGVAMSEAVITALGLVVWGVVLRTVVVWHITWSVNSLTHFFGYRNYETGERSRNNWLVAIFASGEGWHNNHHHDPASASVQHRWWEFDVTYYHIKVLEWLGLATKVIRPRNLRHADRVANREASQS